MWRIGSKLLPCARFRLLKGTQGPLGAALPARERSAAKGIHMTACAQNVAGSSKAVFCDFPLDRAANLRDDDQAQEKLVGSDSATLVLLNGSTVLCQSAAKEASGASLALCRLSPLREYRSRAKEPLLFLGISSNGAPYFAAQASETAQGSPPQESATWIELRKHSADLTSADSSLAAAAHGVLAWHNSCAYSEESGKEMVPGQAGWARMDSSSGRLTYARLDPAVITIVECNGHLLLGSNLKWAQGRYSALAGFVEMGESLEQAASREVFEEAGITVPAESLRYVESQPWPFPRSLMIAYRGKVEACGPSGEPNDGSQARVVLQSREAREAAADSGITQQEIQEYLGAQCAPTAKQEDEMADVRWFHWQWVARAQGWLHPPLESPSNFHIPGPSSLAHRMIRCVVNEQLSWEGASVPECIIEEGRFKYVLLRVSSADSQHSKLIVRGYKRCEYHNDVLRAAKEEMYGTGLHVGVIGGGRILHEPGKTPRATVFGYSAAFGAAVHEVSAVILRRAFPMYNEGDVVVSYEGY